MTAQCKALLFVLIVLAALGVADKLSTCEPTVEDLIAEAWPDDYEMAICIAKAESGVDPLAIDSTGTYAGVFQVSWRLHRQSFSDMLDARANINFARVLYDASGWTPWAGTWRLCGG